MTIRMTSPRYLIRWWLEWIGKLTIRMTSPCYLVRWRLEWIQVHLVNWCWYFVPAFQDTSSTFILSASTPSTIASTSSICRFYFIYLFLRTRVWRSFQLLLFHLLFTWSHIFYLSSPTFALSFFPQLSFYSTLRYLISFFPIRYSPNCVLVMCSIV